MTGMPTDSACLTASTELSQRLFVFAGVRLCERQHEKGLRQHQRVALRVTERALENIGGLAETPR